MTHKTGEVSWTDTTFDKQERKGGGEFLRLNTGSNIVRLLTLPHLYYQHKYMLEGGNKYGYRISCTGTADCPLCAQGDKAKRRWLLGVVERATNTYKILDIGWGIFEAIQILAKDDDWGDPSHYDFDIVKDKVVSPTMYKPVPKPKKPLNASDLSLRADNDPEELVRRTTPPTVEKVRERIAAIKAEVGGNATSSNASNQSEEEDEDESYFKDFDKGPKKASF